MEMPKSGPSSTPKTFQRCEYRKLKHPREIRVLLIMPGYETDELRCILKHIKLKDRFLRKIPSYLAVSYTWGSPEDTRTIRCDYSGSKEGHLNVPSNLYYALLKLRFKRLLIRRVWADSVCINQEDTQERSQQVQMMMQIFANASLVFVWLGEYTERSREICELVDALAEYYYDPDRFDGDTPFDSHPELEESEWTLYREFFYRPWFTRVWVFQEAVIARKLLFYWGEWYATWEKIMLISHCVGIFGNPVTYDPIALQSLKQLEAIERERLSSTCHYDRKKDKYDTSIWALCYLVDRSRDFKATDARDRIFALQGLSQERAKPAFVVDYSLSVEQVYRNFAKYELFDRQDLNILSSAMAVTNLDLPSWVPDWTCFPPEGRPLASTTQMQLFLKAGGLSGDPGLRLSSDQDTLYIKGIVLTKPRIIGAMEQKQSEKPTSLDDVSVQSTFDRNSSFYKETYRVASQALDPYPNGEPRIEAYLKTLVYDYISWHRRLESSVPVTIADGMKFLTKYEVIQAAPAAEADPGSIAFEKRVEKNRRFCLMENGYFGWVPQAIERTDRIAMFVGGRIMYVLRPVGDSTYTLVGECYLYGAKGPGGQELEEIALV